ncbi:hypothetical protein I2492_03190 [Budviciaceae bacterium CWB-B4]|uniref:Uncharacterized protein n=1 Tax=Limnobaculum xujianqingii TaxID=2738837 RepID=A0A9D7AG39_9GAMM|nr:hypothetical protein [Limnobaculum xujianqingii]MBK5072023.1 hypothetical protein [Limnobaculum xujianqingii]MBK5175332.1 hypothetical protein [Limnobaculum xujianqingii]
MKVETFIIGNKEYTAGKMNAFDAGRLLIKLKSVISPALSQLGQGEDIQNGNIMDLLSGLDEKTHEDIIFPILAAAGAYSIEDKRKISSAMDMNMCFSVDTLFDFYLLVWEVLKLNFTPFIGQVTSHFGSRNTEPEVVV